MDDLRERLKAFGHEFRQTAMQLPGVAEVQFMVSLTKGNFVAGESAIDLFVLGDKISAESKRETITLLTVLNAKYKLGLERAQNQQSSPFFVDGRLGRFLYRRLKGRPRFYWLLLLRATTKTRIQANGLFGAGYLGTEKK